MCTKDWHDDECVQRHRENRKKAWRCIKAGAEADYGMASISTLEPEVRSTTIKERQKLLDLIEEVRSRHIVSSEPADWTPHTGPVIANRALDEIEAAVLALGEQK